MIIKGVTITWIGYEGHPEKCDLDIPDVALNDIIDSRLMLYGLTRPKMYVTAEESLERIGAPTMQEVVDAKYPMTPPPEERSCETCDDLRRRLEEAEARIGCAEADRNHEIELREEAERKLAEAWTDDDMRHAFRVGWNYNDRHRNYMEMQEEFNLWLSARRKEKNK
jgi:hypothetical protein